jgi:hypothetical protein
LNAPIILEQFGKLAFRRTEIGAPADQLMSVQHPTAAKKPTSYEVAEGPVADLADAMDVASSIAFVAPDYRVFMLDRQPLRPDFLAVVLSDRLSIEEQRA